MTTTNAPPGRPGRRRAAAGRSWLLVATATAAVSATAGEADALARQERVVVTADWLAARLDEPGLVILHVANQRAGYDQAHVPGARFLAWSEYVTNEAGLSAELPPLDALRRAFEAAGVSDGSTVVVYGDPIPAGRAFFSLEYLGHDRVHLLDGGLTAWRAAGLAVADRPEAFRPGVLTAPPRQHILVDADWVLQRLERPGYALIDARPPNEYSGAPDPRGGPGTGGHIPGAANISWLDMIVSRENPILRDTAELRAMFLDAGAAPGDTVVVYCTIGMRASVAYVVARALGYETRFYDGSWEDWTARGLPARLGFDDAAPADR